MFLDALAKHVADRNGDVAVILPDRQVSYGEFDADVAALTAWLAREGLSPGETVGLTVRSEYRHLVASVALMRLGCIHVTLPSHEPEEYRRSVAERTKAAAVLAEIPEYGLPGVPTIQADFAATGLPPFDRRPPSGEAVLLYLTSSGTTGRAKIMPATGDRLFQQAQVWQWPPQRDVYYRPSSIEFNNAKRQRLYNLVTGTANVFADPARFDILETARRFGVTRLNLSAAQARTLVDRAASGSVLPATCHIRVGGSAVARALRQAIVEILTPNLHVTYATSEFGSIATAGPQHHAPDWETVGAVHPGVDLEVVDADNRPLPPGETGRIRVRAPAMPAGYFDDAVASASAFSEGWFYPGDAGHLTRGGLLFLDGRTDDMMVLASINIFPAEIERVVESMPGVLECAAFSLKSGSFGDIPLLAAVAAPGIAAPAILAFARSRLGLRAPRKVFLVDALPRNNGGKVERDRLRARFAGPAGPG